MANLAGQRANSGSEGKVRGFRVQSQVIRGQSHGVRLQSLGVKGPHQGIR